MWHNRQAHDEEGEDQRQQTEALLVSIVKVVHTICLLHSRRVEAPTESTLPPPRLIRHASHRACRASRPSQRAETRIAQPRRPTPTRRTRSSSHGPKLHLWFAQTARRFFRPCNRRSVAFLVVLVPLVCSGVVGWLLSPALYRLADQGGSTPSPHSPGPKLAKLSRPYTTGRPLPTCRSHGQRTQSINLVVDTLARSSVRASE